MSVVAYNGDTHLFGWYLGFGLAFIHKFLTEGMNLLVGTVKVPVAFINKAAVLAGEMASELLGVGCPAYDGVHWAGPGQDVTQQVHARL